MSSLSLLLEYKATDCIWHTGMIRIVTGYYVPDIKLNGLHIRQVN